MLRALPLLPLISLLLAAQPAADPAATARKALDAVLGEHYADFTALGTPEVQKDLNEAALAKIGAQIKTFGALQKVDDPQVTKLGPTTAVVFPVHFAQRSTNMRFLINSSGRVSGFFLLPGETPWQRPDYSKPDTFTEKQVTVGDGEWKLPGTLTMPAGAGPFPGVVLVHGSLPNDRDETIGGTKVFKDLAEGLASRGIAVLRYEKRTKMYGPKVAAMKTFTLHDETVEDALRAVALMRTQQGVDPKRVFVVGHDLGGYAAPRIAQEDPQIAGFVLMAANARHLEDLLVEQVQAAGGNARSLENAKAIQSKVKSLEHGDEASPNILNAPPTYWLDLKEYDPVSEAAKLTQPMLILQGGRDYQVTTKDFDLWKAGVGKKAGVVMKSYPSLNHLFVTGTGPSTSAEYVKPGHVAPDVIEDIAAFVRK
jgi:dienelactone hydrolase